uniref:15-cis-phytoene synthase n=1 Tax=Pyrodinium bahamense TaxID=73915 RepID=A0A7S0A3I2_9DINO
MQAASAPSLGRVALPRVPLERLRMAAGAARHSERAHALGSGLLHGAAFVASAATTAVLATRPQRRWHRQQQRLARSQRRASVGARDSAASKKPTARSAVVEAVKPKEAHAPASVKEPQQEAHVAHVEEEASVAEAPATEAPAPTLPTARAAAEPTATATAARDSDTAEGWSDGWSVLNRVAVAGWETFVDLASARGSSGGKQWEYRKGIEGMSMGSLHYEMLTTAEGTEEFKELEAEYQSGWGMPFVNLSLRKVTNTVRDISKALGLDVVFITSVNLLETLGMSSEAFDGIPVQNKWVDIVAENARSMGREDAELGRRRLQSMVKNMVMGQMEKIAGAPMPVFLEGYGESCGIYKIVIGPRSVVVVSDPVVLKHIMLSSQDNYSKGILSEVLEPIMGKGLIPADPATWRSRRRAIQPGFHRQWLKETTEMMVVCAESLCDDLEKSIRQSPNSVATLNMEEKFTSVSLDIIGKAVFDYDFGSVARESPVVRAVYSVLREAERRAQSVIPYWNLPGASNMFRDQKSHEENLMLLNAVLDELIRNAMQQPAEGKHASLLQYLVMTKNEDVTTRQLRDDLMTLLIAGHETTAALLTWTLHELMKPEHADKLEKLLEEVDTVIGDRQPTFEDFGKLPVLKWCLLETLRLYPEPPLLIRRCENGDEVPIGPTCGGVTGDTVTLLPGQDIFISTWSLQRSTKLWGKDAAEFNPWRWQKPLEGQGRWGGFNPEKAGLYPNEVAADFAFVPFGGGARKCIGDYFALLEAEVTLISLLQRFSFKSSEAAEKGGPGMTTGATIHTLGGLLTDVTKRVGRSTNHEKPSHANTMSEAPFMEKKSSLSVAQRVEPEALTVPTPAELRMLFTAQAEAVLQLDEVSNVQAIEEAYSKCREVTREHSKTFFLGSQLLAPDEQRVVWAIYNWCRNTDELIDGPDAENTTMADLERWEENLNRTFQLKRSLQSTEWEELSLAHSIQRFSLIERPFQDMIGGMAMDLVKDRYATFQELEVYCYRVAGTVGVMTLPVLGFDGLQNFTEELQEQTIAAAMSLGVAFQLTNILRDIGEDGRRGRIYVPQEDLQRFNIAEDEVIEASNTPGRLFHEDRWRDFMEFQFERCNRFYEEAERGIVGLSEVNRLGVMAALYVYGAILDQIRENKYDNLSRRAYVPFAHKMWLMGRAWLRVQELREVAEENIRSGRIFTRGRQHAA